VARQVFRFDPPERFVAGTVGEPGHRTFYLQARDGGRLVSVALEKEQVSVLAERLDALLDEVVRRTAGAADVPAAGPVEVDDLEPLEQPVVEEFRVGVLRLGWEGEGERVLVEAVAVGQEDAEDIPEDVAEDIAGDMEEDVEDDRSTTGADDDPGDRDLLTVRITGEVARAFVARARAVVAAGRPPCPLCAQPLDPDGHVCPRQNGYRRRG
jgi:uncharacterized repeat protein (TIGR03847 family)